MVYLPVLGQWLKLVVLKVFSYLNDCMIWCFCDSIVLSLRTGHEFPMNARLLSLLPLNTHIHKHTHIHTQVFLPCSFSYMKQAGRGKHNPSGTKLGSRKRKQQCLKVCLKCLPIPEHKYSVFKYKTEINENCDMTIDDDIEQIHSLNRIWK